MVRLLNTYHFTCNFIGSNLGLCTRTNANGVTSAPFTVAPLPIVIPTTINPTTISYAQNIEKNNIFGTGEFLKVTLNGKRQLEGDFTAFKNLVSKFCIIIYEQKYFNI